MRDWQISMLFALDWLCQLCPIHPPTRHFGRSPIVFLFPVPLRDCPPMDWSRIIRLALYWQIGIRLVYWWWIGRLVQDWRLIDGLVLDRKWIG